MVTNKQWHYLKVFLPFPVSLCFLCYFNFFLSCPFPAEDKRLWIFSCPPPAAQALTFHACPSLLFPSSWWRAPQTVSWSAYTPLAWTGGGKPNLLLDRHIETESYDFNIGRLTVGAYNFQVVLFYYLRFPILLQLLLFLFYLQWANNNSKQDKVKYIRLLLLPMYLLFVNTF